MNEGWLRELREGLRQREEGGLLRRLRVVAADGPWVEVGGRRLVNLASNDYLGLSQHPKLKAAVIGAVEKQGTGVGASRLICGHRAEHAELERAFASFKGAEGALLCSSGYAANCAVVTSLAGPGDLVCLDKLSHASLIDACRASGARVRVYPHGNSEKIASLFERHQKGSLSGGGGRRFVVTDSVFSMDGDVADLEGLCELAERHDAVVIVDEAHGTGVLGDTGAGLCQLQGVSGRVDVVVSTGGKALGVGGGMITGRREVIETVVNRGRAFVFSTGVPAGMAAGLGAALGVLRDEPWRRARLLDLSRRVIEALRGQGWRGGVLSREGVVTPIVPLILGTVAGAEALSEYLAGEGFFAPAIRPPTVAVGAARVRLSLRADLEEAGVARLISVLGAWRARNEERRATGTGGERAAGPGAINVSSRD